MEPEISNNSGNSNSNSNNSNSNSNNNNSNDENLETFEILQPPMNSLSLELYPNGHYAKLSQGWTHYQLFEPSFDNSSGKVIPRLIKNLKESTHPKKKSKIVLCLHGLSWWAMTFHPIIQDLIENEFSVLLFDFYGRGRSEAQDTIAYTLDLFLTQAIDLLDYLNIIDVYLIGYSMGGAVSTLFAATHPQRLIKVCELGPAIVPVPVPFLGRVVTWPYVGKLLFKFFGSQAMLNKLETERFRNDISDYNSIDPLIIEDLVQKTRWMINQKPNYLYAFHSTLCNIPFSSGFVHLFPQIPSNLPILIILGTKDQVIPFDIAANTLKQSFQNARVESLDCGHSFTLEKPKQVADLITNFFIEN